MNDFPWLTTLMVVPLVGSLIVAALPKAKPATAKAVTLGFSLVTLVLVVVMALQFDMVEKRLERIEAMIASKRGLAHELLEGTAEAALTELDDAALLALVTLDLPRALMEAASG